MKFLCLGYYDEAKSNALPKAELAEIVRKCRTHDAALRDSGRLDCVGSLKPPAEAVTIRPRAGRSVVKDGPFSETKELIGAFFIIEAADRAEAVRIASLHPAAQLGEEIGWGVEVRAMGYYQDGAVASK